jgi:hypothetical protein
MHISIAELFEIMPLVKKSRRDLFRQISDFLRNQLLSQTDPSVELERQIIDLMGQLTDSEFLMPLLSILTEFAARYDDFALARQECQIPDPIQIAVLSFGRWATIAREGKLLPQYDNVRTSFERYYAGHRKNCHLIWCDPSSVLQVKVHLGEHDLLFLFNGVQFAIMDILRERSATLQDLQWSIRVDDLPEQVAALVAAGMIVDDEGELSFNRKLDLKANRNFAREYTSAENFALLEMKELVRNEAIKAIIVTAVKRSSPRGISMSDLVHQVSLIRRSHGFQVDATQIREQTKVLEVMQFVKMTTNEQGKDVAQYIRE